MKKIKLTLCTFFALIISIVFTSCTTPADYCDSIMRDCGQLEKSVREFTKQIASKDNEAIQKTYDENLAEINDIIEGFQKKGAYKDETYLLDAATNFALTYKDLYENEYATCLSILKKEKKTYEDGDKIALMVDDVATKTENAKSQLADKFNQFVKEYELIVSSSK